MIGVIVGDEGAVNGVAGAADVETVPWALDA